MNAECLICKAPLVYLERDSYLAILTAVDFAAEHLGVQMETQTPKCSRSKQNNQCIGSRCPFSGGKK